MARVTELAAFQALIIGVGEYEHPVYDPLPAALADSGNVATLLSDGQHCTYDPTTIEVLTGTQATRQNIVTALVQLARCTAANCTTLVYFSGHGSLSTSGESYLLPYDSDPMALNETAIPEELFSHLLAQITTQRVVIILDACHANGAIVLKGAEKHCWNEGVSAAFHERLSQGAGRVVIASSRKDQPSYASKNESRFTKRILDGLRGAAARPKEPFISILDLYQYVNEQMRPHRRFQSPSLSVKDLEDFPSPSIPVYVARIRC